MMYKRSNSLYLLYYSYYNIIQITLKHLLLMSATINLRATATVGVAPGDESELCVDILPGHGITQRPAYPNNTKVLMDSLNYEASYLHNRTQSGNRWTLIIITHKTKPHMYITHLCSQCRVFYNGVSVNDMPLYNFYVLKYFYSGFNKEFIFV